MEFLAKWYVYELIDPRSGKVFYVGKGCGNRIDHHEKEALNGVCSHKCNKIRKIIDSGRKIIKRKIALFWDESAAYECESDRVDYHGLENLTNVVYPLAAFSGKRLFKFTPTFALEQIKNHAGLFALWLRCIYNKNVKAYVNSGSKLNDAFTEAFLNQMAEMTLLRALEDKGNIPRIVGIFREHNLEVSFVNGSAD